MRDKVEVTEQCTGCGVCCDYMPNVFALNDANRAEVISQEEVTKEEIEACMRLCPVEAIVWKK